MARPKSDNKREAILQAAVQIFAAHGLSAPTSALSRAARIAEGTLFTYFPTKDDLLNAVYRDIKLDLADALMSGCALKKDMRSKLQHVWDSYVNWGVENAERRKVLSQLQISDKLTKETKAIASAPFAGIGVTIQDAIASGAVRDLPPEFTAAVLEALAQATMDLMTERPTMAARYRALGFDILWTGIMMR